MEKRLKVFFTCSTSDFDYYKNNYRRIISVLNEMGVIVSSNINLEEFESSSKKDDYSHYSNSGTYFPTIKKISQADLVIIDASVHSMTMGSLISYALSLKKRCLLLTEHRKDDPQDVFLSGMNSPLLEYKIYKHDHLEKIIRDFIKQKGKVDNVRLNFVVEREVSNRLDWLSFKTKKSKTEIIRRALDSYEPEVE